MSRLRLKTLAPLFTEHGCTPEENVVCCTELRGTDPSHPGMGCGRSACPNPPDNECQKDTDSVMGPWEIGVSPQPLCFGSDACVTGCCFPNAPCENLESDYCVSIGGTPERDSCSKPDLCPGACCLPRTGHPLSGSICATRIESSCIEDGGVFFATGEECLADGVCKSGCCFGDVRTQLCFDGSWRECAQQSTGIQQSLLCAADPCDLLCCLPDGNCFITTGIHCTQLDGEQVFPDCNIGECRIAGCCPPVGEPGVCVDIPVGACKVREWIPQDGSCKVSTCWITGCCTPFDTCRNLTSQDCLDLRGDPQHVLCTPTLCEKTGCCCPDGSCSDVTRRECTRAECISQQVLCAEDPCSEWACCLDQGRCEDLNHRGCILREGIWKRDKLCIDDPCDDVCCWCGHCCDIPEDECDDIRGKFIKDMQCDRGGSDECRAPINVPKPPCNRAVWKPNVDAFDGAVTPVSDRKVFMWGVAGRAHVTHRFNRGRTGFRDDRTDSAAFAMVFGQWYIFEPATCRVSICETVIDENGFAKFVGGYRCGCAPAECAGV